MTHLSPRELQHRRVPAPPTAGEYHRSGSVTSSASDRRSGLCCSGSPVTRRLASSVLSAALAARNHWDEAALEHV